MTDLAEFLLARIAEDEAAAKAATPGPWTRNAEIDGWRAGRMTVVRAHGKRVVTVDQTRPHHAQDEENARHVARHDPARVLAECEAKREMVEALDDLVREHENTLCNDQDAEGRYVQRAHFYRQEMLRFLALPYADHPDFRDEWRR